MLRAWVNVLSFLSSVEASLAERIGETGALFCHFMTLWGLPVILVHIPGQIAPAAGIALAAFYVFVIAGDVVLSVFGHHELETRRGMLDITSVQEIRGEILAALIKYVGGAVSFATIYSGLESIAGRPVLHVNAASGTPYFDRLYFSFITIATVGYGDIYPLTGWAKLTVISEIGFGLGFAVLLFSMLVSRYIDLQRRKERD
jgi:hypothetical protein